MDYKKGYLQEKKKADIYEIQLMQMRYQILKKEIENTVKELEEIDKKEKEQAKNDKKDLPKAKV